MNPFAWYPPPPPGFPPPGMSPPFFCPPPSWEPSFWAAPGPFPPPGRYLSPNSFPPPPGSYTSADTYSQPAENYPPAKSYSQPAQSIPPADSYPEPKTYPPASSCSQPAESCPPADSFSQPAKSYSQPGNYQPDESYPKPEQYSQPTEGYSSAQSYPQADGYPPAESYLQPERYLPPNSYTSPAAWHPPAYGARPQGNFSQKWQGKQVPAFGKRPEENNKPKAHAPGAKRIKLDSPEEIARWREERKRNFPTLANVERKKAMQVQKEERGEVLTTQQFGKMKGMWKPPENGEAPGHQGRHRKRQWRPFWKKFRKNGGDHVHRTPNEANGPENSMCEKEHEKQEALSGQPYEKDVDPLSILANGDVESDKDETADEDGRLGMTVVPKQVTSALSALSVNYGSASDSEPEEIPVMTATKAEKNQAALRNTPQTTSVPQSRNSNQKRPEHAGTMLRSSNSNARSPRGPGNRGKKTLPPRPKRRPTLLEMLLAQDIRHERNVILQCVRYLIRNNMFGLHFKTAPQAETETEQSSTTTTESSENKLDESNCSCSSDLQLAGGKEDALVIGQGEKEPVDQTSQMVHLADEDTWETPSIQCEGAP
ncbi:NUFIP1, FMR1 interacting protein 1 [Willisornis vidua]|uniref:NUFIP1, FMR1 interacting protein 1 n=1 Tax=Willisornis vidua TaxID=1566151 RepID=A0ABQ9DQA7_9PASS|nr:NUFIP1, FMR1 interacting protein 1 [Willisornis vidua]